MTCLYSWPRLRALKGNMKTINLIGENKFGRSWWLVLVVLVPFILTGCGGETEGSPGPAVTTAPVETASPIELPATNDIGTADSNNPIIPGTPTLSVGEDDLLPIDEILSEIDNDVCQTAYETKLELEALIAAGADVAELETAVEELIVELENCPTPTPQP